jgi:hypothetical protein
VEADGFGEGKARAPALGPAFLCCVISSSGGGGRSGRGAVRGRAVVFGFVLGLWRRMTMIFYGWAEKNGLVLVRPRDCDHSWEAIHRLLKRPVDYGPLSIHSHHLPPSVGRFKIRHPLSACIHPRASPTVL